MDETWNLGFICYPSLLSNISGRSLIQAFHARWSIRSNQPKSPRNLVRPYGKLVKLSDRSKVSRGDGGIKVVSGGAWTGTADSAEFMKGLHCWGRFQTAGLALLCQRWCLGADAILLSTLRWEESFSPWLVISTYLPGKMQEVQLQTLYIRKHRDMIFELLFLALMISDGHQSEAWSVHSWYKLFMHMIVWTYLYCTCT